MQHRMPQARRALLASAAIVVLAPAGAAMADTLFVPALAATGDAAPQGPRAAATAGTATGAAAPVFLPGTPALATTEVAVAIPRITAFGDSYSRLQRSSTDPVTGKLWRVRNWLEQSVAEGNATAIAGYAVSGATAASKATPDGTKKTFAQQVTKWVNAGASLGAREVTSVYFGYNDINSFASLADSKTAYKNSVARLVSNGTNQGERRTFLFLVHDWGKNPAQKGDPQGVYRQRTQEWNASVAALAGKYAGKNVVAVDLYTTFENVFANPSTYGLTNVKTVDTPKSSTTALFADDNHFGEKGQDLIQQVFLSYATRGTTWSSQLATSSRTMAEVGGDIGQGLALGIDALPPEQRLGLNAFAVGDLAQASLAPADEPDADVTRAGFVQAFHPDERPDGGVGVNYALSPDTAFGVVIGSYQDTVTSDLDLASASASVRSDTVSVYLSHKTHGFDLRTRLTVADEQHVASQHDELIDATSRASFDGRTTEMAQRVGYPVPVAGTLLTPWVELSHQVQEMDSFTVDDPYVSDVTYSSAKASDTLAGIGLDSMSDPIRFGTGTSLRLYGGLSYTQSLARDDYRVTISEAAGLVPDQIETIERETLREVGLSFGGQVAVGERLSVGAGVALSRDLDQGSDQQVAVRVSYRF
jgi:phospholipase/lecithinase/hemolysin